jgi:hypothetical protein
MNLATIKNKVVEGIKLIMVQPTMFFNIRLDKLKETDYTERFVGPFESGRPDLIALDEYGDSSKADLILKFNGISDPFSILEGETIKIPRADFPFRRLDRMTETKENLVKSQFMDTKRLSKKDRNRAEAMKKKYNKENLLPPNVISVGKRAFKFEAGQIIFGAQAQNDPVVDSINNPGKNSTNFSNGQDFSLNTDQLNDMLNR